MLEPQSNVLFAVLLVIFIAFAWWMVRTSHLAVRLLAGCLAFLPAMLFGVMAVNKYYGYYPTWGSALADLTNQGVRAPSRLPQANLDPGRGPDTLAGSNGYLQQAQRTGYTLRLNVTGPRTSHHPGGVRVPAAAVLPAGLQPV